MAELAYLGLTVVVFAERFARMRATGIRTIVITGDNPLTARAIADESGVDAFLAEATSARSPSPTTSRIPPGRAPRWLITEPGMGYRFQPGPAEASRSL